MFQQVKCQNTGALSNALAGNSILVEDVFAVINNPGIIDSDSTEAGVSSMIPYGIHELMINSFCIRKSFKMIGTGLGVKNIQAPGQSIQDLYLSAGKSLGTLSFGGSIQLKQIQTSENGSHTFVLFNIGARSTLIEKAEFGVFISNISQSGIQTEEKEVFDSRIKIASAYKASDKTRFYIEIDKQVYLRPILRAGVHFGISKMFVVYSGFSYPDINPSFGFSADYQSIRFVQAISFDQQLGFSPSINLQYAFRKKH